MINDRFGHEVGDQFLIQIGHRLLRKCSDNDILGRLGGDEFLVARLSPDDDRGATRSSAAGETSVAAANLRRLPPGDIHLFYPGASLGVVEIDPLETDVNCALHLADSAMYKDKNVRIKPLLSYINPCYADSSLNNSGR